jgi:hypothetical protein
MQLVKVLVALVKHVDIGVVEEREAHTVEFTV